MKASSPDIKPMLAEQKSFLKESLISQNEYTTEQASNYEFRNERLIYAKRIKYKSIKQKYFSKKRILFDSNILFKLFFSWITPLLAFGNRFYIKDQAIPYLPQQMKPENDFNNLYNNFKNCSKSNIQGFTLLKAIFKSFKKIMFLMIILVALSTFFSMYTPILTNQIMSYVQNTTGKQLGIGIVLFFAVFWLSILKTLAQTHLNYQFTVLGFNLSNTLSLLIFSKALKYPVLCQKKFLVSDIVNYSQTDAQRLTYLGFYMSTLLFTPIQIIVGIILMYSFIGISFLSGIGVMVLVMISTFFFSRIASKANDCLLKKKDQRLKVTEQIFNIIRFIKINAMEKYFFKKLNQKRNEQLKMIKKVQNMGVIVTFLYWLAVPLILSITFATFTWIGEIITPTEAFTSIILFRILQFPLRLFPTAIAQIIQIWSSIKRIQKFLLTEQIDTSSLKFNVPDDILTKRELKSQSQMLSYQQKMKDKYAVCIRNGSFQWESQQKAHQQGQIKTNEVELTNSSMKRKRKESQQIFEQQQINKQSILSYTSNMSQRGIKPNRSSFGDNSQIQLKPQELKQSFLNTTLSNINIDFEKKKFTMILGDIGSGKSSLLYAILNEMKSGKESSIYVNGSLAYAAQKPWIMSSSVKQNITLTFSFDEKHFQESLKYAALDKDINLMSDGINTQIGQKGVNLSGGQRARISLARAIYSNRDIYLLDDVISAVDVHVGKFLMEETILGHLKEKTVLMATHAVSFAEYADHIVFMKKGKIIYQGSFQQISKTKQFKQLVQIELKRNEAENKNTDKFSQNQINSDELQMLQTENVRKKNQAFEQEAQSFQDLRQSQLIIDSQENIEPQKSKTQKLVTQLMLPQDRRKGELQWKVYKNFIDINGGIIFAIKILVCMIGWITLSTLSNIQIQRWCEDPIESQYHLYVYLILAVGSSVFMLIRTYFLVISTVYQGTVVHKKMIKSLLYASIPNFYNRIPIGRIINRLTNDLRDLDQNIGYKIGNILVNAFSLLGNLLICIYASSPWIIIPMIFIAFFFNNVKNYYMKTQRQIIRLDIISISPIVGGFISTINGLATIRAYNLQDQFLNRQLSKIQKNKRIKLTRQCLQGWFSLRLTFLSLLINMSAIGYSIFSENSSSSLVGLLLTYALTLNQDIIFLMFSAASLQANMVSVERVMNFMEIQSQPGYIEYCKKWRTKQQGSDLTVISQGNIQFDKFSVRYRQDLPQILKNISLKIRSGQKVGIVGRTGAGKSTIASCLLRILDPSSGKILIDGINILDFKVKDLRSCITMIQQQPTLINGSIKQNLDPGNQYTLEQVNQIVEECHLKQMVDNRGGLEKVIGNDTLSIGQKQLLCICRAFLKKSKIVLIDQATANIDIKNDQLIQDIISKKFTSSTVLTIAHRLSTLKNSDKILVLGQGRVLQWGNPNDLMNKKQSIFKDMVLKNSSDYLK